MLNEGAAASEIPIKGEVQAASLEATLAGTEDYKTENKKICTNKLRVWSYDSVWGYIGCY